MKRCLLLSLLVFIFSAPLLAQFQTEITVKDLREQIGFLASDSLKGRKPGTPEDRVAAGYIRNNFLEAGLTLLGEEGFQYFEIFSGAKLGGQNTFSLPGNKPFKLGEDFTPLNISASGDIDAQTVFVGYGLENHSEFPGRNDYKDLDCSGKCVLVFTGYPLKNGKKLPVSSDDYITKVVTAKDHGAGAVLFVSPESAATAEKIIPFNSLRTSYNAGIPVLSVSVDLANEILKSKKKTVKNLADMINRTGTSIALLDLCHIKAQINLMKVTARTQNVVGMIPVEHSDEYLVIGAHYDHLGMGGTSSRSPDEIAIHNGADDNASGTAGIMELAQKLAANRALLKRNIVFIAFSGEEMGLIGSKEFVRKPLVDIKKIKAMMNLDMVGRLDLSKPVLSIGGTGTFEDAENYLGKFSQNRPYKVKYSPDGFGPSDHASFYAENIPVFFFFTGFHDDYHKPSDDADKINYEGEKAVLDLIYDLAFDLATRTENLAFKPGDSKQASGHMTGGTKMKVTLGIVPDVISSETTGLRVDGVKKGGVADKAGILKGDIITSINDQQVTNIYDYMERLTKLEKGQLVPAEILRDGEKITLSIQF